MNRITIKKLLDIALPIFGIILELYYRNFCGTACSYLRGTIFGADLVLVGILLMGALLVLNLPFPARRRSFVDQSRAMMLSGSLGGEVLLVRFQIVNDVYCSYCLVFGLVVLVLFILNFRAMNRFLAAASFVAGLLLFHFFFEGSVLPLFPGF
ncbi:MAG: hypothetical protein M0Q23_07155 [Syntrophales bacterium]|jgi:hypothetical protein|nr:hypothetical protein [Syntrophales bacterium]MCK9528401.1 hypothetical protein [Syntrophales bacterium]MDX9922674.1 hypothetical protein [Syntrophales bacterium]